MDPSDIIRITESILRFVIIILMTAGTIVFIYGIIGYIFSAGEEEKRAEFKKFIVYGIIGLFSMVAVWGLVRAIVWGLGLSGGGFWGTGTPPYPPNSPAKIGNFFYLLRTAAFFILSPLIRLMFVLGTVVFLWGTVQFIAGSSSGDEKKIETGKKHLTWGIVALFLMVAMWGIVTVMQNTFGWTGLPYLENIKP